MTMNRKEMYNIVVPELVNPDNFIVPTTGKADFKPFLAHKDGSFTVRKTYYFSFGRSTADWSDEVQQFFHDRNIEIEIIEADENWNAWPKYSYWRVRFKVVDILNSDDGD
jgi:hypothetical protein